MLSMKKRKNARPGIFLFGILFVTGLYHCSKDHKQVDYVDQSIYSIDTLIEAQFRSGTFSGTVIVAGRDSVLYEKAFGMADRAVQRSLELSTPFYLASVSKQFTAAAIMLLYQDGLLAFDDLIMDYLPDLPGDVYDQITIRHLLNHTSGIPDYYEFASPWPGFTNEDVFDVLLTIDSLQFAPGNKYQYSNSGYVLLSIIVDKVTGRHFGEFLKERILDPVGMKQCTVKDQYSTEITEPAIGYDRAGKISDYRYYTTGGGGIYASAEDLYLWDRALYTGKIIDLELLKMEAWKSGVLNDGTKTHYGFGWNLSPDHPEIVRHGGDLDGFRTHFFRDTKSRITIIILSNSGYEDVEGLCDGIYGLINSGKL